MYNNFQVWWIHFWVPPIAFFRNGFEKFFQIYFYPFRLLSFVQPKTHLSRKWRRLSNASGIWRRNLGWANFFTESEFEEIYQNSTWSRRVSHLRYIFNNMLNIIKFRLIWKITLEMNMNTKKKFVDLDPWKFWAILVFIKMWKISWRWKLRGSEEKALTLLNGPFHFFWQK